MSFCQRSGDNIAMPSCKPQIFLPDYLDASPIMAPLRLAGEGLPSSRWPSREELQRRADELALRTARGLPLRFVPQGPRARRFEDKYEPRIYLTGEVQTRADNWHDLFNALAWLAFPRTKAEINRLHYEAALIEQNGQRSRPRDILTLFDESGIVVATDDNGLAELVRNFRWKELFWQRRQDVVGHMGFYLFGHSLYEKVLFPHLGITAKALVLPVETGLLDAPLGEQLAALDQATAERLARPGALLDPGLLTPLPFLGVPGWWPENRDEAFYDNEAYFCPRPVRKNPH